MQGHSESVKSLASANTFAQLTFNGTTYTFTVSAAFRRHTPEEEADLRAAIAEQNAVTVPVVLYYDSDLDLDDCVLDGQGRLTVAAALPGPVSVPFKHVGTKTTAEAYTFAEHLNDCRRHETPAALQQRRAERLKRVVESRSQGQSLRAIAKTEGVSEKQIRKDLKAAGADRSAPAASERVKGTDGKMYAATRPTPAPKPEEDSTAAASQPERERRRQADLATLGRIQQRNKRDAANSPPDPAQQLDSTLSSLMALAAGPADLARVAEALRSLLEKYALSAAGQWLLAPAADGPVFLVDHRGAAWGALAHGQGADRPEYESGADRRKRLDAAEALSSVPVVDLPRGLATCDWLAALASALRKHKGGVA